jgi:DNA-binding transcriptional regulator LsrR (DeoR family)
LNEFAPDEVLSNPAADTEQVRARVAWYYYVGGLTQQEIADKLSITRLRVNKIVVQARSDGLVSVDIKMPLTHCVALEEKLKDRFGLIDCSVVPSVSQVEDLHRVLGRATAAMLDPLLIDGKGFGIGWGQTLSAARRHLTPRRLTNAWVAALMGGLTRGSGTNTFEVSTEFARILGAECYYVAAPIYCPSSESRTALLTHYGLAEAMQRGRNTAVALIACGDLSDHSLLVRTQVVTENLPTLREAGAVGDILGVFLDQNGEPVDHPLNQRVMAMRPPDLKLIPSSILASGGMHKALIIKAVLRAGYVNRLVTDEDVAEAILRDAA